MRELIHIDPDYQRPGSVWNLTKKQLFIDSLLNRYDIPKLYFHEVQGSTKSKEHKYAIVDGRQRLETIWSFIDGVFPLAEDFKYFEDPHVAAQGMTYQDLSREYPRVTTRLNARSLTIMVVTADELDVVEDMFSRLNEAVPLNAAERRNAFGGPLPIITRRLAKHAFFGQSTRIPETRYRHQDLAAKFLYLEKSGKIVDTKKASLDAFFRIARKQASSEQDFATVERNVHASLDKMKGIFVDNDRLLKSSGMCVVYYVLVSRVLRKEKKQALARTDLVAFEQRRAKNREAFAKEEEGVDLRLIEFDELAQSSNDGAAIRMRYEILRKYLEL